MSPPPLRPCCTVHTEDLKRITLLYKRVKVIESISLKLFKGVLHCIPEEFNLLYSIIQKRFNRHFVLLACLRTARGSPPYIIVVKVNLLLNITPQSTVRIQKKIKDP